MVPEVPDRVATPSGLPALVTAAVRLLEARLLQYLRAGAQKAEGSSAPAGKVEKQQTPAIQELPVCQPTIPRPAPWISAWKRVAPALHCGLKPVPIWQQSQRQRQIQSDALFVVHDVQRLPFQTSVRVTIVFAVNLEAAKVDTLLD